MGEEVWDDKRRLCERERFEKETVNGGVLVIAVRHLFLIVLSMDISIHSLGVSRVNLEAPAYPSEFKSVRGGEMRSYLTVAVASQPPTRSHL